MVKTPDSQSGDTGSTPVGVTTNKLPVRLMVGREFLALKMRVRFFHRQPIVPDRTLKQFPYDARTYQPSTSYCSKWAGLSDLRLVTTGFGSVPE